MDKNIKITTLVENTATGSGLLAEHGISFRIEYGQKRLLFDTGQSGIVTKNAQILGIDLADTDAIVISHGHYDHTGGLDSVLNCAKRAKIYLHPDAVNKKYSLHGGSSRFIAIAGGIKELIQTRDREKNVVWTKEPTEIFDGLFVTGQIPRVNDFETDRHNHFFLDEQAGEPDIVADDQSVFFNTDKGLVVVLGCAHTGVINILDYVVSLAGVDKIYAVMGGMHLLGAGKKHIAKVIDGFKRLGVQKIGPAHCTGLEAAMAMRQAFAKKCFMCSVGSVIEFKAG